MSRLTSWFSALLAIPMALFVAGVVIGNLAVNRREVRDLSNPWPCSRGSTVEAWATLRPADP